MEHDSLLASPNDDNNGRKQQKGSTTPLLVMVSTAILLLGLVFYGGDYLGSPRAVGVGSTDGDDVIPIGDSCPADGRVTDTNLNNNCATPPGLDHGVCLGWYSSRENTRDIYCQTGQPGAFCDDTFDCVKPPGLDHPVCRKPDKSDYHTCQSGTSGADCGQTFDCVIPTGLNHAVCRNNKCQS